jgi:hypothetical protein
MSRAAQTKAKKSVRLELACVIEGLESRFLLTGTPVTWTGTTGNWNVAANWSTNAVPDGTDDVTIPTGADVTVSDTESADSVTTATGSTLEVVSGGTLNLGADPSTVNGSLDIGGTIGTIAVGSGTLTLVGTTTWTGGAINLQQSKVINAASGVMNLSGTLTLDASGQIFGTLENLGTINQSSGTLTFNEVSAIDNFGTYDITGDANLVSTEFLGAFAGTLVNETGGLFEKTGGTGDSTVSPALINNGTIQAGSGQLSLTSTTLTQIQVPTYSNTDGTLAGMPVPDSNLTITGGTFAAVNGATLNLPSFPAGDSVTANQGTLIVNGVGSNITGISNLNRNSGDMTIENGADYTTAGDFINDGDLDIGQGSTFDVMGGYTQTSGGTLTVQVGGTATGDYGTLNSTDVATLGGTLDTVILNTYTPSNGDNFNIITYPGEGGAFSATTTQGGGSFSFTPSLGNTGVSIAASVDTTPPTSTVNALAASQTTQTFTVSWTGMDYVGGSGIATYDIFVSDNGGAFTPFQTNTALTSAPFTGQVGHTYGFYSVATDNTGNVQAVPSAAQATTSVSGTAVLESNGVVSVMGTDGNDTIHVAENVNNVVIKMDNVATRFPDASVTGIVRITAVAGNDSITLGITSPTAFVNGGGGGDTIVAKNDAADTIQGGMGADSIVGGGGNEDLDGGNGFDTIVAGSGNDTLTGDGGGDSLVGGSGADLLLGGTGADTLSAHSATSTLKGNGGNDSILGNGTGASITGNTGDDSVIP